MYVEVGGDHSLPQQKTFKEFAGFLQPVVLYMYMAESECCESLAPYWYLQPKFEKAVHTVVTMVTYLHWPCH